MADYLQLLELEIEDPDRPNADPVRYGFTDRAEDFEIQSGDGSPARRFGPGLFRMDMPGRKADFFSGTSSAGGSASAALALDAFPVLDLRRRGVRLQRIRSRMWWWPRGGTLADAVQLWRGELRAPVIDFGTGTFSCRFEAGTRERDVAFPPGFIGDQGRFDAAPEASRTQPMQVVYGQCSEVPVYAINDDSGVGDVHLLVAAHAIQAQNITIRTDPATVVGTYGRGVAYDARGGVYSYVVVPAASWPSPGATVYAESVLGYESPQGNLVEGLGDVLVHLTHTYGGERFFDLDRPRIFGARVELNRFRVGMYFNSPDPSISIMRVLQQRIASQFPVVFGFVNGLFGWDYVGVPRRGGPPVKTLVYGQDAFSRGVLSETPLDEVRARYEMRYRQLGFAAGEDSVYRVDETNSAACQGALARWGVETVQRMTAPDIFSADGAFMLIEDEISRRSKVRWGASYGGLGPEWMGLPMFARVHVTDPGPLDRRGVPMLQWAAEPFLITGLTPRRDGRVNVDLIAENGY